MCCCLFHFFIFNFLKVDAILSLHFLQAEHRAWDELKRKKNLLSCSELWPTLTPRPSASFNCRAQWVLVFAVAHTHKYILNTWKHGDTQLLGKYSPSQGVFPFEETPVTAGLLLIRQGSFWNSPSWQQMVTFIVPATKQRKRSKWELLDAKNVLSDVEWSKAGITNLHWSLLLLLPFLPSPSSHSLSCTQSSSSLHFHMIQWDYCGVLPQDIAATTCWLLTNSKWHWAVSRNFSEKFLLSPSPAHTPRSLETFPRSCKDYYYHCYYYLESPLHSQTWAYGNELKEGEHMACRIRSFISLCSPQTHPSTSRTAWKILVWWWK